MKKLIMLFSGLLSLSALAVCQTEAFTNDGRKVLLFSDGSWKFAPDPETETDKGGSPETECTYQLNTVNEKSGRKVISLEPLIVGQGSNGSPLWLSLRRVDNFYGMYLEVAGLDLGCLKRYDSMLTVKFEDGAVYDFAQISKDYCDGNVRFFCMLVPGSITGLSNEEISRRQPEMLERLRKIPVESFRIRGEKQFDDIELNQIGKNYFMAHLGCME